MDVMWQESNRKIIYNGKNYQYAEPDEFARIMKKRGKRWK